MCGQVMQNYAAVFREQKTLAEGVVKIDEVHQMMSVSVLHGACLVAKRCCC